jgi:hypothetical protein
VAREAAAVRDWATAHRDAALPLGSRAMTVDPRWATFGWIFLAAALAPAVSWGIAAL